MSQESPNINDAATVDKLELHARQQLSALVDGELAPDEARFLLRRLQHDTELAGRYERWQLGGDVLRGQVRRVAAADLSTRVAAAIATMPADAASFAQAAGQRRGLLRWGGGAALAASVAAIAMMVTGREELPQPGDASVPMVAMQTLPSTEARMATPPVQAPAALPPQVAVASAQPVAASRRNPSRSAAAAPRAQAQEIASVPATAVAADTGTVTLPSADPFGSTAPLQARPWPRAVLSQPSSGAFTASFGEPVASRPFYPFEPGLHAAAVPAPADQVDDLPAPPPEDDGR